jgi:hypothetical protein
MKSHIIEELGQADILVPLQVAEGLAANDRIKVRMAGCRLQPSMRANPRIPRPTSPWNAEPPEFPPPRSQR